MGFLPPAEGLWGSTSQPLLWTQHLLIPVAPVSLSLMALVGP